MDRVGFEGGTSMSRRMSHASFSILWWIELVLRDDEVRAIHAAYKSFSILWWIELVLRETVTPEMAARWLGFSILWWIELVLRGKRTGRLVRGSAVSVSSGGSSWF